MKAAFMEENIVTILLRVHGVLIPYSRQRKKLFSILVANMYENWH